jgi:hypothetical protein
MPEKNILMKMTIEKNKRIKEVITKFLGHEPSEEDKKQFNILTRLEESIIYYKGELVGTVRYKADEGPII